MSSDELEMDIGDLILPMMLFVGITGLFLILNLKEPDDKDKPVIVISDVQKH